MGIILSILKILGMILLSLLGLVILVIFLILFVPIRYKISSDMNETMHLDGKISWLLSLVRAKFSYEDELLYAEIGILWKKTCISKKFGVEEEEDDDDDELSDTDDDSEVENAKISAEFENVEDKIASQKTVNTEDIRNAEEETPDKDSDKSSLENSNKKSLIAKLEQLIQTIKEKVSFIKKKIKQIKKLIQDEKNKQAVKHLKDELIYLIKILLPKKSRLNGIFSTGAPDTTGQTYGVICCFPIIYQDNWSLVPDFEAEKAYFKGDFYGKGRIYVFQLVGILFRIIIDKNCRRLYYILKRLGGQTDGRRK